MKIAAGLGQNKNIVEASKMVNFEVILTKSEEELIDMLLNKKVRCRYKRLFKFFKYNEYFKKKIWQ